jgi:hypothetical protein
MLRGAESMVELASLALICCTVWIYCDSDIAGAERNEAARDRGRMALWR